MIVQIACHIMRLGICVHWLKLLHAKLGYHSYLDVLSVIPLSAGLELHALLRLITRVNMDVLPEDLEVSGKFLFCCMKPLTDDDFCTARSLPNDSLMRRLGSNE